jgi:hypothetical protein
MATYRPFPWAMLGRPHRSLITGGICPKGGVRTLADGEIDSDRLARMVIVKGELWQVKRPINR